MSYNFQSRKQILMLRGVYWSENRVIFARKQGNFGKGVEFNISVAALKIFFNFQLRVQIVTRVLPLQVTTTETSLAFLSKAIRLQKVRKE